MKKNMYRVLVTAALLTGMNSVANAQLQGLINRGKQALKNEVKKEAKKEIKEQGAIYCDCPGCKAALDIINNKNIF